MAPSEEHVSDEILSERIDGLLVADEVARVEDHLATCRQCAARAEGLTSVRLALRSMGTATLTRDFRLEPMGRVDLPPSPRRAPVQRVTASGWLARRVIGSVLSLFGLILILAGVATLTTQQLGNSPVSSASTASLSTSSATSTSNSISQAGSPTTATAITSPSATGHPPPTTALGATPTPVGGPAAVVAPNHGNPSPTVPAMQIALGTLVLLLGGLGLSRARARARR